VKKYNRFFAFGCSFTKYKWPTWADILGKNFAEYTNLGRGGAGNFYIFKMLMDLIISDSLTENDLIIICWSAINREDRFLNGDWQTWGNIYRNNFYDKSFIKKYCDIDYFYMRDLTFISAAYELLKKTKCKFLFTSIVPIKENEMMYSNITFPAVKTEKHTDYSKYLNTFLPNFKDIIFEGNWYTTKRPKIGDYHPTPLEHLSFVKNILIPNIDDDIILDEKYIKKISLIEEKIYKDAKL
jgi:hypothetical protein